MHDDDILMLVLMACEVCANIWKAVMQFSHKILFSSFDSEFPPICSASIALILI